MDELCISKRRNLWLWTAVSRYTGQILAYLIGDRTYKHVEKLHALLPARYRRRRVYTDGYEAYSAFFWPSQHRVCQKFDGGTSVVEGVNTSVVEGVNTSVVEGVNTSVRHRCSFLVRRHCVHKHCGPRNQPGSIDSRLSFAARAHNAACRKRWEKRQNKATQSTA